MFPGVDLLGAGRMEPGHVRQRRGAVRRQRGRRQLDAAGVAADIYQKYTVSLQVHRLLRQLLDQPRDRRDLTVANGTYASLSDRGWVSLTLKATF